MSKRVKMNAYGYCCGCIYTIHHSLRAFFFIFSDAFRSCVYMNWLCVLMTKNKQIMWWKYDAITMLELHKPEHRDVQCDGPTFIWLQTFEYQYEIFSIVGIAFSTENSRKKIERKTPHWISHCDSCNIYVLKILYRWNMKNRNIAPSIEHTYILIYGLISAQIEFIYGLFLPFAAAVTLFKRFTAIPVMAKCVVIFFFLFVIVNYPSFQNHSIDYHLNHSNHAKAISPQVQWVSNEYRKTLRPEECNIVESAGLQ